jgi:hypothetical protein
MRSLTGAVYQDAVQFGMTIERRRDSDRDAVFAGQ